MVNFMLIGMLIVWVSMPSSINAVWFQALFSATPMSRWPARWRLPWLSNVMSVSRQSTPSTQCPRHAPVCQPLMRCGKSM